MSKRFGLKPVGDDEDWTVFWTDASVLLERVMDMKRYQVSHTMDVTGGDSTSYSMHAMIVRSG